LHKWWALQQSHYHVIKQWQVIIVFTP
jgi:hypothetical protein